MSRPSYSTGETASHSYLTEPKTKERNYIRCDKCRLKFPKTDIGAMDLKAHRGGGSCYQHQAERAMHKAAGSQPSTIAISSVSAIATVPPPRYEHPAVLGSGGLWTKKCDLCQQMIGLGHSIKGNCFEGHRNSRGCQQAQKALAIRPNPLEKEQENPKGIMKFFARNSSQPSLSDEGASSSKTKCSNKMDVEYLPGPSLLGVQKHAIKSENMVGDRKPSDADRTTLARDILWALAPVGAKRKNVEDGGNPKKKLKSKDLGMP